MDGVSVCIFLDKEKSAYGAYNIVSSLNYDGWNVTASDSEKEGTKDGCEMNIHFIDFLLVKQLTIAHEPLYSDRDKIQ
jgi:hypothetical protein